MESLYDNEVNLIKIAQKLAKNSILSKIQNS